MKNVKNQLTVVFALLMIASLVTEGDFISPLKVSGKVRKYYNKCLSSYLRIILPSLFSFLLYV